LDKVSKNLIEI